LKAFIEDLVKRGENDLHAKVTRAVERILFTRVLQETHGHQSHASERLGLGRSTLRYKMRDLGLTLDRSVNEGQHSEEGGKGQGSGGSPED
jgi:two-component system nitrogen regulation response regulator GlnG